MRDLVIFHFGLFLPTIFARKMKISKKWKKKKTQVYQKSWSYAVLFLRYGAWQISLFYILGYFLPFYLPSPSPFKPPKKSKFQKKWKKLGDIIILRMCTKDDDKMMYYSWDMVCNRRRDGQMDRKVTYRGGCLEKKKRR